MGGVFSALSSAIMTDNLVYHVPLEELSDTRSGDGQTGSRSHSECGVDNSRLINTVRVLSVAIVTTALVTLLSLGLVVALMVRVGKLEAAIGRDVSSRGTAVVIAIPSSSAQGGFVQPPLILFSAMNTFVEGIVEGRLLVFVNELSNFGNGYDNKTGIFTAPHTGTYLLSTTVCARRKSWVYVHLVASGINVVTTGTQDLDASGTCASATAVVIMRARDRAWVEGAWNASQALYNDGAYSIPLFTGVLLRTGDV